MESNTQKRKRVKKEGAEKVYEDDRWLIVRPFTIEASSMYGRNTQWCTVRNPNTIVDKIHISLFYGYLASGVIYYILDKSTSSRDNKYRKVGIQKNWDGTELWNDATNKSLTSKDIETFKNKLNKHIVKSIYDNWNTFKPTTNKPFVFNPLTIIKSYYNKNLPNHIATAVVNYDHNLKVKGWVILLYFLITSPLLPFIYLFRGR
jgi:hypothetical protein|tara:strand:+ start:386 stop:997 length:612 start_codon:yes stop_codon:yes gene_type:complete